MNGMQNERLSGSKKIQSIGIHASNNDNSDSENDNYPLRASKMKDLKHPAKPLFQNETDVDVTILSNKESDEEDYHSRKSQGQTISASYTLFMNRKLLKSERCFLCCK